MIVQLPPIILHYIDLLFPPYSNTVMRVKPRDMIYISDDKPPHSTIVIAAVQHATILLMGMVFVVLTGQQAGLNGSQLRGYVALSIVVIGIASLIQGLKTRFSSGQLITHGGSILTAATFLAVTASYGIGAATGAIMVSGVALILLSRYLPKLQPLFPPEVTGVLLVLLALSLMKLSVGQFVTPQGNALHMPAIVTGLIVLATTVGFSVWGGAKLRVFALVFGVVLGIGSSLLTGEFGAQQLTEVQRLPLVEIPFFSYKIPVPQFVPATILPVLLIELISALGSIGTGVAIDRMTHAKWRRSDMTMISRLLRCHGIGILLNGLTGTNSTNVSNASLGVAYATGIASRYVAIVTGVLLMLVSLLPMITGLLTLLPHAVMGAMIFYTASYMFASGNQLLLSRMMNNRRMFMIGISTTTGAILLFKPELVGNLSTEVKLIVGSGVTVGVMMAILLNQLFRIGVSKTASMRFAGIHAMGEITRFMEECGADWGAREDVIIRARYGVGEAIEVLYQNKLIDGKDVHVLLHFDEYKLSITLQYVGKILFMASSQQIDLDALFNEEGDDLLDAMMVNVSGKMLKNLADEISSSAVGNHAKLNLKFEH